MRYGNTNRKERTQTGKRDASNVPSPKVTNTSTILARASDMQLSIASSQTTLVATDGMQHMNLARGRDLKRKEDASRAVSGEERKEGKVCKVVQSHTLESLERVVQSELRAECARHDVAQNGSNPQLRERLGMHYRTCQHSHKPGGAASDKAHTYYDSGISQKMQQCLIDSWAHAAPKKL